MCVTHTPMPINLYSNKYLYYPYIGIVNMFKFWLNIIMNYTLNVYCDALKQITSLHFGGWYPAILEYWHLKLQIQIYVEIWSINGPQGEKKMQQNMAAEEVFYLKHMAQKKPTNIRNRNVILPWDTYTQKFCLRWLISHQQYEKKL